MISFTGDYNSILKELNDYEFEIYNANKDLTKNSSNQNSDTFNNKIIGITDISYNKLKNNPILILKCLGYASMLNLYLDNKTDIAIRKYSFLLNNVSAKNIKKEFIRLLCGSNAENILRLYSDIIEIFIPEIRNMYGFDQHTPYHIYDVWEHTLHAVGISENTPLIRTAIFFHDIAKPDCFTMDEKGIGHFKGHALLGAEKAKKILKRMSFSSEEINDITIIIANHRYTSFKSDTDIKRIMNTVGHKRFFSLIKVMRADDYSKGTNKNNQSLNFAEQRATEIISNNEFY